MKTSNAAVKIIEKAVADTLPPGKSFQLYKEPVGLDDFYILRIITPAWSRLRKMDRFAQMQDAVFPLLPSGERDKIFRISVLTPTEWEPIKKDRGTAAHIERIGGSRKLSISTNKKVLSQSVPAVKKKKASAA